jgi:hypothetical protein
MIQKSGVVKTGASLGSLRCDESETKLAGFGNHLRVSVIYVSKMVRDPRKF